MKNLLVIAVLLISNVIFCQKIEPTHEIIGDLIKSTYFHDNGKISQEGFYKNGKVEGLWISYDENGVKKSEGSFENGIKTGKWLFFDKNTSREVVYIESRIASIKNIKQDAIIVSN